MAGSPVAVDVAVVGPRDPGGFDGSLERCAFRPSQVLPIAPAPGCDVPRRYGDRATDGLAPDVAARVALRGFDRAAVAARVDQVVLHYDAAGTSRRCFEVLHDERGLSCHFLLDVDGTIYQTLDLALRARHATVANDRSVGIEIAHVGAYPSESSFDPVYSRGPSGMLLTVPARLHPPPGGPFRVARDGFFRGAVNGRSLVQPDFTEAQYESLGRLLVALRRVLPRVEARIPRAAGGAARTDAMTQDEFARFRGVIGHQHIQSDKTDPGPAFDWERVARAIGAK